MIISQRRARAAARAEQPKCVIGDRMLAGHTFDIVEVSRKRPVPPHDDNTGMPCRHNGLDLSCDLGHDCCYVCEDIEAIKNEWKNAGTW